MMLRVQCCPPVTDMCKNVDVDPDPTVQKEFILQFHGGLIAFYIQSNTAVPTLLRQFATETGRPGPIPLALLKNFASLTAVF